MVVTTEPWIKLTQVKIEARGMTANLRSLMQKAALLSVRNHFSALRDWQQGWLYPC